MAMGDYRNKLKREADQYRQWRQRCRHELLDRIRAGERFVCWCGAVSWQKGQKAPEIWCVTRWKEANSVYCTKCKPVGLEKHVRELRRIYGEENFDERPDAKQLALFAEGLIGKPKVKPRSQCR